MQIIRTIVWVALLALLLLFSYFNWSVVSVKIWDNIVVETKVPALVIVSFLLGLVPMWIFHRGAKWSLTRKIVSLENAARSTIAPAKKDVTEADPAAPAKPAEPDAGILQTDGGT